MLRWTLGALGGALLVTACSATPGSEEDAEQTTASLATSPSSLRALLANPGLAQQPMKGVFYFPGDWEAIPPLEFYDRYPYLGGNANLYTLHPAQAGFLGFSESVANQTLAVQSIAQTGANVIVMSYWGPPGVDNWMFWAPMQDAPEAQEQLFDAVVGTNVVVMPAIEDSATTTCSHGFSPKFRLAEILPDGVGSASTPSGLINWVVDLVNRFVVHPSNPAWPAHFAQMYDATGTPRYVIQLKDVGSTQADASDASFSASLATLANAVKTLTGVDVGFVIDPLQATIAPPADPCDDVPPPVVWVPRAALTGPLLQANPAVLAIQAFRSEILATTPGPYQYANMAAAKRDFNAAWGAYLPVIADVSAGYDGHLVFPSASIYGHDDAWRNEQSQLRSGAISGLVFTAWNGYTEGWAGMATLENGSDGTDPGAMNRWLSAIYLADPRLCNHVVFVDGQPTYYVYGIICETYYETGGSDGRLGAALSSEESYAGCVNGRYNQFENGKLVWCPGWTMAQVVSP